MKRATAVANTAMHSTVEAAVTRVANIAKGNTTEAAAAATAATGAVNKSGRNAH